MIRRSSDCSGVHAFKHSRGFCLLDGSVSFAVENKKQKNKNQKFIVGLAHCDHKNGILNSTKVSLNDMLAPGAPMILSPLVA